MLIDHSVTMTLNDLWHWNGDLQSPVWTSVTKPSTTAYWPPQWQAPQGWTSDGAEAGELWLVGGSGSVQDSTSPRTENYAAKVSVHQADTSKQNITLPGIRG